MEQINLKATLREIKGSKVNRLRKTGKIPANLYGRDFENINLTLDTKEFSKIYDQAGSSAIVNLQIENDGNHKVLIHEPQLDPVLGKFLHVDLYKVNMKQEIHTEIPLEFVGESAAVSDLEGNLITMKDALEVECLPDKLVPQIEVDIAALKTFDDVIKVADLNIPEGIKVLAEPEEMIAQVTPPRSEEELAEMEETSAADQEKAQIEGMEKEAEAEKAEGETEEKSE